MSLPGGWGLLPPPPDVLGYFLKGRACARLRAYNACVIARYPRRTHVRGGRHSGCTAGRPRLCRVASAVCCIGELRCGKKREAARPTKPEDSADKAIPQGCTRDGLLSGAGEQCRGLRRVAEVCSRFPQEAFLLSSVRSCCPPFTIYYTQYLRICRAVCVIFTQIIEQAKEEEKNANEV